jgi:hypothetical protein
MGVPSFFFPCQQFYVIALHGELTIFWGVKSLLYFKQKYRMHRSLKQGGTRRGTLNFAGTGGQKEGLFGESTGPVDNVPSDAPLGGNRKCTEQSVPAPSTGCSGAVRLAVRNEVDLVGLYTRPPSKCLLSQRNKANIHSSANASVEGIFALLGGRDGVTRGARSGGEDGSQQRRHDSNIVNDA